MLTTKGKQRAAKSRTSAKTSRAKDLPKKIMALELPMIPQQQGKCDRSGACCTTIPLEYSPARLRQMYIDWRAGKPPLHQYIWLIYPMLRGRCRGKRMFKCGDREYFKYIYGPCKHLSFEQEGIKDGARRMVATCTIHDIRPRLCSGYPFYGADQIERSGRPSDPNPGYMRGCGFNADSMAGMTREEFDAALLPLEPHERDDLQEEAP